MPCPDEHGGRVELRVRLLLQVTPTNSSSHFEDETARRRREQNSAASRLRLDAHQSEFSENRSRCRRRASRRAARIAWRYIRWQIAAARTGAAAFEQIARQKLHVRADAVAGNFGHLRGGGQCRREKQGASFIEDF